MQSLFTRAILVLMSFSLTGCLVPDAIRDSENHGDTLLSNGELTPHQLNTDDGTLYYLSRGNPGRTVLLYIHGTPGDWRVFSKQLSAPQLGSFYQVAIDRPGWGQSGIRTPSQLLSLSQQSQRLRPLLHRLKATPQTRIFVIGHSLGGSLVARMAMDHPDLVDGGIVIAGDLTSEYLPRTWYNEIATWWLIQPLLPNALLRANDEVLALPADLDAMAPLWSQLEVPMLMVFGQRDSLVDPRNSDFANSLRTRSTVQVLVYPDEGHLFVMGNPQRVNQDIHRFVTHDGQAHTAPLPPHQTLKTTKVNEK